MNQRSTPPALHPQVQPPLFRHSPRSSMSSLWFRSPMVVLSALLVFSCLGCRDDIMGSLIQPPLGGARLHENYVCSVDVVAESTTCRAEMTASSAGGPARAVYPSAQVAPSFRRAVYTAADSVYRTEVKMWNNTSQPLGTRDGSTSSGVKVFFQTTPRVTLYRNPGDTAPPTGRETPLSMGDSGIVKVRNADGSQTFTALNQPYFTYPQIIDVGWASEYKEWQFTVSPNVARFDFTVRVFAATPNEPLVPAVAPDTAPQEIFQSKYHMADTAWITGTFLRHVVRLAFQEAATQEERQSAVDLVQGEVVGGMSLGVGDGLYLVRIPDNRSVSNPVRNAIEKLESLPQVDFATVLFVDNQFTGQYRLPVDGPNFEAESWNINPDSASGINWPLEAISAPLAWGCSQGDSTSRVPIGVVDTHLKVVPDLAPNVTRRFGVGLVAGGGHGTAVTSILGARGNNRLDMTGVLWHADLRLYEVGVDSLARAVTDSTGKPQFHDFNLAQRISMAAREGAAVVNLSMGLDWTHKPGSRAGDSARVQRVYPIFRRTARSLLAGGKLPLIVISAGNDTADAYWNGLTLLRRDFPDNVIVVANAAKAGPARLHMAHNSNHGTLVDIAAPGDSIVGIDNNDQYRLWSGTSFAAPFASGTAGLLFSFDPSLRYTPALVKQLILAGARRTGRRIQNGPGTDSLPVLDAYAALKEAGGRRGAPLCGNRVWASRGKFTVERGPGLGDEVIYAESLL